MRSATPKLKSWHPRQHTYKENDDGSITGTYLDNAMAVRFFSYPGNNLLVGHRPFTTLETYYAGKMWQRRYDRSFTWRGITNIATRFSRDVFEAAAKEDLT